MKNVLVISSNTKTVQSISRTLSSYALVKNTTSCKAALEIHNRTPFDIIFIDFEQPEIASDFDPFGQAIHPFKKPNPLVQFVVITKKQGLQKTFKAAKEDIAGLLTHPLNEEEVQQVFESVRAEMIKDLELDYLRDHFWKTDWLEIIYSRNPIMKKVYENIRSVAPTAATVLLFGETGTGKGLLARLIHWHSHRYEQPFIAVHCGAIPDTLIESELFGHEKGAFTGADRRKIGKFEVTSQGTIFLDEIGTITTPTQIKLLQVLQDGTFSRVGGTEQLKTDARIITATNSDLKQLTEQGLFRKDLYYRLNVFPMEIPPLRDRLEDLSHFIKFFLNKLNEKYGKRIHDLHPAVKEGFKRYDWPGNIRELENILERAYILENGDILGPQHFPSDLVMITPYIETFPDQEELSLAQARQIATEEFERSYLKDLLKRCKGKMNLAAKTAQVTTRQLNRLMTRHGIRKNDFKS
jgi:DNA-binding NtrC family response regulator